uniref:Si:ch211-207d6.2 n=1 Tax=Sinocyclocheilus anshuiensis TaxID=1608454 RepID=A0A671K2N7_9TELE
MQSYNMDHKKEAFLEHLKQKYPHHASVIMGHQERLRDQIRSSGHSVTPQSAVGEPGEHLSLASLESLEAMSEGEAPSAFTRGSRSRASLPVVKSNNQAKDRSLGVLYLQYGEETKQIRMPNEVTGADTIKALFVSVFPQHLTMKTLESPSVAIYIKDDMRNMYYELTDVRNITSHSCLKVYHKDPAQAFNHNTRANNGEIRVSDKSVTAVPLNFQVSMSPPTPRSMPSSPSRIPFGHSVAMPGGATLPRDRMSNAPPSRSITPCSSAILERRDVKPDEDLSSKSTPLYSEAYGSPEVQPPVRNPAICSILSTFGRNVSDLRLQLHQLKQMQLQNQDVMRQMLRQAEQEISEKFSDIVLHLEDPVRRQRVQVEEDRHRYLGMEERVLVQLGELENYVEMLKKESTCAMSNRPVTLKDVEEGAVNLRKVGEALATLKGEFPALQMKMRGVLRVEVEAVRFLKEEPHKMDSMLKRVKALTDTLSGLRRSSKPVCESPTPQPRSPAKVSCSEPVPSSPVTVHRIQTAPISTHHPSPPLTPTHGRDSPTVAKVSPRSRENIQCSFTQNSLLNNVQNLHEELFRPHTKLPNCVSKRAVEEDKVHSTGLQAEKEMERILQQTQASLMKAIPDLEVSKQVDSAPSQPPSILPDEVDSPLPVSPHPEAAPQDGPKADKPVQTSLERPQKPTIEKPHRASVDRVQPNPETASKSPPPPPPRRFYPSGTGLTTGRSGEVIYSTRKESTSEGEEEAPKPKPLRVPPEVKPKPRTPPPVNTSTLQDEEDEGDKIMAELQVSKPPSSSQETLTQRHKHTLVLLQTHRTEMEPGLSLSYHTKVTDVMFANSPSQFNNSAHMSSQVP